VEIPIDYRDRLGEKKLAKTRFHYTKKISQRKPKSGAFDVEVNWRRPA
jgi:hypothetical protein